VGEGVGKGDTEFVPQPVSMETIKDGTKRRETAFRIAELLTVRNRPGVGWFAQASLDGQARILS
jgi:hypothetical protein